MQRSNWYWIKTCSTSSNGWSSLKPTERKLQSLVSEIRWVGFQVDHCLRPQDYFLQASKLLQRIRTTSTRPIKCEVCTTWNRLVPTYMLILVLPPMLEVKRICKTQHMTTDADIRLVCCGPTIEAVYRIPNFPPFVPLKSLEHRLDKSSELKNSYTQTNTSDLDKSCILKVDKEDCSKVYCPREWYPPHHPVFHRHKPGKVQLVLYGAAKFHGSSLSNALLTKIDLLPNLKHVLIRFRQYHYAVFADIEGMFLQVGLIPWD